MPDDRTPRQRSETMRRVRSSGTSCERLLRAELRRRGVRFRSGAALPGKPDIVIRAARLAIFVDGCFWHGCPEHCRRPASNRAYWNAKISRNMARDAERTAELRALGWRVLRLWEHEVHTSVRRCGARIERMAS